MHYTENLIIGAGPGGLAVAGCFTRDHLSYMMIEQTQQVAHSWHHHYDRLHLHTVKELSYLPYKPYPSDFPKYISRHQFAEYCDAYAREFQIKPHFGQEASSIRREGDHWQVDTTDGNHYRVDRVIIATGFNRKPYSPRWSGMDDYQGTLIHSREYQSGADFRGKKVLVVGMGNTGAEIAADLAEQGAMPSISVRGPVNVLLRDPFGRPVQKTAIMLAKLPNWLGDGIGRLTTAITVGNLEKYGLGKPKMAPSEQLRVLGQTPVIDVGTLPLIKQGKIKVLPEVQAFTTKGVRCNSEVYGFDAVILATGYRAAIEDFLEDTSGVFDERGVPRGWKVPQQPGLYFVGYDCYTPGGLLYVIRRDAMKVAAEIGKLHHPVSS